MKPVKIIDRLYLGNADTGKNLTQLRLHNITAVVNVSGGKVLFPSEINYYKVHLRDSDESNITDEQLEKTMEFIKDNITKGKNVLVHCSGGISRSPCYVIAYLAKYSGMTLESAVDHVKECRAAIRPRGVLTLNARKF